MDDYFNSLKELESQHYPADLEIILENNRFKRSRNSNISDHETNKQMKMTDFDAIENSDIEDDIVIDERNEEENLVDSNELIYDEVEDNLEMISSPGDCISLFHQYSQTGKRFEYIHHNSFRNIAGQNHLFPGSKYTLNDISMTFLSLRQQFSNCIGDKISSAYFSIFISLFREYIPLLEQISTLGSSYNINQLLLSMLPSTSCHFPCFIFQKCLCGDFCFTGEHVNDQNCQKCRSPRLTKNPVFYYLPFGPRLKALLDCKVIKKLFNFPKYRHVEKDYISDIFDGYNWQDFHSMMSGGESLIGLELSWDGVRSFDKGKQSMWPIFISILNFPSILRSKIHVGMHLLAMDDGGYCSFEPLIIEFQDLWRNGISYNGVLYRVAILRVLCDGRGLEKMTKTSGFYC
jgi:hypothetical protein